MKAREVLGKNLITTYTDGRNEQRQKYNPNIFLSQGHQNDQFTEKSGLKTDPLNPENTDYFNPASIKELARSQAAFLYVDEFKRTGGESLMPLEEMQQQQIKAVEAVKNLFNKNYNPGKRVSFGVLML